MRGFRSSDLDLWVLIGFGIISEQQLLAHPELLHHDPMNLAVQREARLRIGAWMIMHEHLYGRVILVSRGPFMAAWSDAVGGSPMAERTKVVILRRGKTTLDDKGFVRRLECAFDPYKREISA